jgi:hypothetical protein
MIIPVDIKNNSNKYFEDGIYKYVSDNINEIKV